jgi:23S rRNA (cytosine1962-C5)-methyltransferase
MSLEELIADAWQKRAELHAKADLDCYRVFHGYSEGAQGLVIDAYGPAAVIRHGEDETNLVPAIGENLCRNYGFSTAVATTRRAPAQLVHGAPYETTTWVTEDGLRFGIELAQARNPGLYLDARPVRRWLRENSSGRRILNLFSFTGSLGLAASVGGARSVVHVDLQKRALERCRENYKANGVSIDGRDTVRGDAYQHMKRAASSGQQFGGAMIDVPPGLHRGGGSSFEGLCALAGPVVSMLSDDGWVLCFFHHTSHSHDELEQRFIDAAGVPLKSIWRGTSGEDFPESDPTKKLRLSAMTKV